MIPGGFTVTSQVAVTFALALLVIGTVIGYGFMKHGVHFLSLFVPSGVPKWLLPVLVVTETISFLSRPNSLSLAPVRQHAGRAHRPGLVLSVVQLGSPTALWTTAYGRIFAAKMVAVACWPWRLSTGSG